MNPEQITIAAAIAEVRQRLDYPAALEPCNDTLVDVFERAVQRYPTKLAFSCMGRHLTFAELDQLSGQFAAYLQQRTDLRPGDRIALQMPNILQFPVALFGALRAGLVIVNTNPLYTQREMEHQFSDSGARAIVILTNMASKLEPVLPNTCIKWVIITELADLHAAPKRWLLNAAVKHLKKLVPAYDLPQAICFRQALNSMQGQAFEPVCGQADDLVALQYTGGTTGVSKGAMLSHANLIANMHQCEPFLQRAGLQDGEEIIMAPLPLYHVYAFMLHCVTMLSHGNHSVLIPNPRDIPAFLAEMKRTPFTVFVGLNTLFVSLMNHDRFRSLQFQRLKLTLSGGMALTDAAAREWQELTDCSVVEGYGLTESSPVVTLNPPGYARLGSIGIPLPGTEISIRTNDGVELPVGEPAELCVRGPQVMLGYWQRPEATVETVIDGWLYTGDIGQVEPDGFLRIVDRKKDMIIVSGFNVYPNEIENIMAAHPEVLECAVIGVPDASSGEAVKLFVVPRHSAVDAEQLRDYARANLTAYKVPRHIEFRSNLPKSNVGKVLRRELRN
jgi:long-chain acyl-CoA synthetase